VPELLDLILLAADLEGLASEPEGPGEGVVIEAHTDKRRGNTATLIVQRGTVRSGEYVVAAEAVAPVRIMENFAGKSIQEALPGSPVRIVGFSTLPAVGARFKTVEAKKDAEAQAQAALQVVQAQSRERRSAAPKEAPKDDADAAEPTEEVEVVVLPLIIKSDVSGTGEAVLHEIEKIPKNDRFEVRVVSQGVGAVSEGDVKLLEGSRTPGIIVGFNVGVEREAKLLAERLGVALETFTIIYKLAEWLGAAIEERRPRERVEQTTSSARVIKVFSSSKQGTVLGGKVEEGALREGETVLIVRREAVVGEGKILSLQAGKSPVKKVEAGSEFGALLKANFEAAPGDYLRTIEVVFK
jgi:translation initiation factor IF-2